MNISLALPGRSGAATRQAAWLGRLVGAVEEGLERGRAARRALIAEAVAEASRAPELRDLRRFGSQRCYARHLLHADPLERFSILALVWRRGQFSPVHGHHAWCAFALSCGRLLETRYAICEADGLAIPQDTLPLAPFFADFTEAADGHVHRLGNAARQVAVSLHVYGRVWGTAGGGVNRPVVARTGD
ncbi:MAG: cysteine dioxygenase family protein [Alphaproteobacteria bacterium]|nr:cysteine dioxygenase family protein [Alphaproteobacteria bacterium]